MENGAKRHVRGHLNTPLNCKMRAITTNLCLACRAGNQTVGLIVRSAEFPMSVLLRFGTALSHPLPHCYR